MEDFKKMFDGVYGWTVEAGNPIPPKQDLPQFVRDRADYFWEMAEDGLTFLGAMECIFIMSEFEVVGNIYENQDLLEVIK